MCVEWRHKAHSVDISSLFKLISYFKQTGNVIIVLITKYIVKSNWKFVNKNQRVKKGFTITIKMPSSCLLVHKTSPYSSTNIYSINLFVTSFDSQLSFSPRLWLMLLTIIKWNQQTFCVKHFDIRCNDGNSSHCWCFITFFFPYAHLSFPFCLFILQLHTSSSWNPSNKRNETVHVVFTLRLGLSVCYGKFCCAFFSYLFLSQLAIQTQICMLNVLFLFFFHVSSFIRHCLLSWLIFMMFCQIL